MTRKILEPTEPTSIPKERIAEAVRIVVEREKKRATEKKRKPRS